MKINQAALSKKVSLVDFNNFNNTLFNFLNCIMIKNQQLNIFFIYSIPWRITTKAKM